MAEINVIPEPRLVPPASGSFVVDETCRIVSASHAGERDAFAAGVLRDQFQELLGLSVPVLPEGEGSGPGAVRLQRLAADDPAASLPKEADAHGRERFTAEGYTLHVYRDAIDLSAISLEGLFYGVQTLVQLLRGGREIPCGEIVDYPALRTRGLFLNLAPDLRWYAGSQTPTLDYLKGLLRTLSEVKINTLILEYGDKFPYRKHAALNNPEVFSIDDIRELVEYARRRHIRIIPLLQCLGHLDYVLVHPEYAHLKEGGEEGRQVCPLNPRSFELFTDLAEELLDAHPHAKYFHVGGDETRELGACPRCAKEVERAGPGPLYVNHVSRICTWVKERGKTPIVWDDMLCAHPEALDGLAGDATIMYWDYRTALEKNPMLIARPGGHGAVYDQAWDGVGRERLTELQQAVLRQWQARGVNLESELSEEFLPAYGAYLGEEFPKYIRPFPYLEFYLDKGLEVIGAPSVLGCGLGYILPDPLLAAANTFLFSRRLAECGCEGIVTTWWTSEAIPFEVCWYATICAAESAWNPAPFSQGSFNPRFCRQFFGVENCDIAEAVFLLNGEAIPYAQSYFPDAPSLAERIARFEGSPQLSAELDRLKALRDRTVSAVTVLQRHAGDVRHHRLAYLHLCLAAKTVLHKVKQVLVFHDVESILNGSRGDAMAALSRVRELKQELVALRDETATTFGMSMKPDAVKEDLEMRFSDEEKLIDEYLDQLAESYRSMISRGTRPSTVSADNTTEDAT